MRLTIAEALRLDRQPLVDDGIDERRKDVSSRPPSEGRRSSPRRRVLLSAIIVDLEADAVVACRVDNVSDNGARLKLAERRFLPATFWLITLTSGLAFRAKTIWREDDRLGVEVGEPVDLQDPASASERRLQKIWTLRR
jgi:hypothetical protein